MTAVIPDEARGDLGELIMRSALGCHDSFAELHHRTFAQMYVLALRLLRGPDLASEVLQEVFLEVWVSASKFDPCRGTPLGWMLTLTHRRAVDRVRSTVSARTRDRLWGSRQVDTVNMDDSWCQLEALLNASYVRGALHNLSVVQRDALYLTYLAGYTPTEAAHLLGIPVSTAKTRMRDGLIRLRQQLDA